MRRFNAFVFMNNAERLSRAQAIYHQLKELMGEDSDLYPACDHLQDFINDLKFDIKEGAE